MGLIACQKQGDRGESSRFTDSASAPAADTLAAAFPDSITYLQDSTPLAESSAPVKFKKAIRKATLNRVPAPDAYGLPRRIEYSIPKNRFNVGETLEVEIMLTDSVGERVDARKMYVISARCTYFESKETENLEVKIQEGSNGVILKVPLKHSGPLSIILESEELRGTELFLKVLGNDGSSRMTRRVSNVFHFVSLVQPQGLVVKVNPPYSSDGYFRADGIDEAKLFFYLDGPADIVAPVVTVMIVASSGTLSQGTVQLENTVSVSPIVTLRSTQPGTIQVSCHSTNPNVPMDSASETITIRFAKPVDAFYPDTISAETHLLSFAQITIVPKDKQGNPIEVDKNVSVFARPTRSDIVKVSPDNEVVITPSKLGATFNLVPISLGQDKVILSVRNYPDRIITVTIMFPYIYLILSTAFGLLGGFLKVMMANKPDRNYWNVPVGGLSGNIAILAALFFKVGSLTESVVLNQFVFCLVAFAGGWAGPRAADWLADRFFPPKDSQPTAPANTAGNE